MPFPSPGDLPDPGIELTSPALKADSLPSELLSRIQVNPNPGDLNHHLWDCILNLKMVPSIYLEAENEEKRKSHVISI